MTCFLFPYSNVNTSKKWRLDRLRSDTKSHDEVTKLNGVLGQVCRQSMIQKMLKSNCHLKITSKSCSGLPNVMQSEAISDATFAIKCPVHPEKAAALCNLVKRCNEG